MGEETRLEMVPPRLPWLFSDTEGTPHQHQPPLTTHQLFFSIPSKRKEK